MTFDELRGLPSETEVRALDQVPVGPLPYVATSYGTLAHVAHECVDCETCGRPFAPGDGASDCDFGEDEFCSDLCLEAAKAGTAICAAMNADQLAGWVS